MIISTVGLSLTKRYWRCCASSSYSVRAWLTPTAMLLLNSYMGQAPGTRWPWHDMPSEFRIPSILFIHTQTVGNNNQMDLCCAFCNTYCVSEGRCIDTKMLTDTQVHHSHDDNDKVTTTSINNFLCLKIASTWRLSRWTFIRVFLCYLWVVLILFLSMNISAPIITVGISENRGSTCSGFMRPPSNGGTGVLLNGQNLIYNEVAFVDLNNYLRTSCNTYIGTQLYVSYKLPKWNEHSSIG